jgi:Na+/H+-dicarboxylate symporter
LTPTAPGRPGPEAAAPAEAETSRPAFWMLAAIGAAVLFAWLAPAWAVALHLGGDVFLRLLKMIVVPLVMTSVASGILNLGDVRRLGRAGAATMGYYLATTLLAVLTGLLVVNLLQPGQGAFSPGELVVAGSDESNVTLEDRSTRTLGEAFQKLVLMLFTDNLFRAMAEGELLPLIVFAMVFAGVLTTMGRRGEPVSRAVLGLNDALMQFVMLLMRIAPLGIFCLVASQFGRMIGDEAFLDKLGSLAWYMAAVIGGLALHFFLTLPLVLFLFTRRNPYRFIAQMSEAVLTAFSTASSSATLPVSLQCAQRRARVSRRSTEFVLPLGATINMDGTALYEAVAAIFIAQGLGIPLGPVEQATIVVTATLAAIGAAGIPQAGLVTMVIVLGAVGLPLGAIGLLVTVDVVLDRFRTAVNVFGDAVGAAVVEKAFRA